MSRELDDLDREFADLETGGGDGGDRRRRGGGARLLPIAVAVIALAVFGGIVWYAYNQGVRSGSEEAAPLLRPEGQAKVQPEDPGGMDVAHTDKEVYDRISGEEDAQETVERILPPPEDPMSPPAPEDGGADVASPEIPSITASEGESEGGAPAASGDGERAAGTETDAAAGDEEPPLPDENLAAPESEPPTAAPTEEVDGGTRTAAAEPEASDTAAQPETASDEPETAEAAETSAADDTSEAAGSDESGAETEAGETETAAADPASGWRVQIAALGSEEAARRAWERRREDLPQLLGDLQLSIQRAEVNGEIFYRVRGGPLPDRAAAEERCAALKAEDQGCLVVSPEG